MQARQGALAFRCYRTAWQPSPAAAGLCRARGKLPPGGHSRLARDFAARAEITGLAAGPGCRVTFPLSAAPDGAGSANTGINPQYLLRQQYSARSPMGQYFRSAALCRAADRNYCPLSLSREASLFFANAAEQTCADSSANGWLLPLRPGPVLSGLPRKPSLGRYACRAATAAGLLSARKSLHREASSSSPIAAAAAPSRYNARRNPWFGWCSHGTGPCPRQPARRS